MPLKPFLLLAALLPCFAGKAQIKSAGKPVEVTEFKCDTIYKNGSYQITLLLFRERELEYDNLPNTVFMVSKWKKDVYIPFYTDSIYNWVPEVLFEDFNGDTVPDILVQNTSSARSSYTYNLYLFDTSRNRLKKINGFEEIFSPQYLPEHDLVQSYALSGVNWIGFYAIVGNRIRDFGVTVEDHQTDDDRTMQADEDAYKKALGKVLKMRKQHK